MPELPPPVVLVLPWSCLVSDNDRFTVHRITHRRILTSRYRNALAAARLAVADQWRGPRWVHRVAVTARVFSPPGDRDVQNFTKILADALQPHAIYDDKTIKDWRIVDMGHETEYPRAELELVALGKHWQPGRTTWRDQWGRPVDPFAESGSQWYTTDTEEDAA